MSTHLTQKEAWLFISRCYENYNLHQGQNDVCYTGLCGASLWIFKIMNLISLDIQYQMQNRLQQHMAILGKGGYIWPCDKEHSFNRAKLALRFSEECED